MNNFIRILSLILALIIAVSSLGACSKKDTAEVSSNISSKIESEPSSNEETTDESEEAPFDEEVWDDEGGDLYEDLEQEDAEEDFEYTDYMTATLNIYNKTPVQSDFMGFGGVYHAFPYRKDMYGRQYDEKMAAAEIKRAINSGITMARTHYEIPSAWDEKTKSWDWESDEMKALYRFCLELKKGDVEVLVNHWYCSNFLFVTYPWRDAVPEGHTGTGHEAIAVAGDQQKTIENFAVFMSETVKQLKAHGCTNALNISIATEPYATWKEEWADIISRDELVGRAAKDIADSLNAVSAQLKKDGIRKEVTIMGPNFAGVEGASHYYGHFKKYAKADTCDLISLHSYCGKNLIEDNYDLWREVVEEYKTEVNSFENFVYDEYNCSPDPADSIQARHNEYNGLQLALAQICFMNYGMKGSFLWSLLDQQWPDNSATNLDSFRDGVHMCGIAPTFLLSSIVFPPYYSFSLVANALGDKGSKLYRGDDDTYEGVYAAMSESPDGEISIVVASTNIDETQLTLNFEKSLQGKTFYRHVYEPYNVVCTTEGELINPDLKLTNTTTALKDIIKPFNVVVYTTKKLVK